jgi:hypothetical protein
MENISSNSVCVSDLESFLRKMRHESEKIKEELAVGPRLELVKKSGEHFIEYTRKKTIERKFRPVPDGAVTEVHPYEYKDRELLPRGYAYSHRTPFSAHCGPNPEEPNDAWFYIHNFKNTITREATLRGETYTEWYFKFDSSQ